MTISIIILWAKVGKRMEPESDPTIKGICDEGNKQMREHFRSVRGNAVVVLTVGDATHMSLLVNEAFLQIEDAILTFGREAGGDETLRLLEGGNWEPPQLKTFRPMAVYFEASGGECCPTCHISYSSTDWLPWDKRREYITLVSRKVLASKRGLLRWRRKRRACMTSSGPAPKRQQQGPKGRCQLDVVEL